MLLLVKLKIGLKKLRSTALTTYKNYIQFTLETYINNLVS